VTDDQAARYLQDAWMRRSLLLRAADARAEREAHLARWVRASGQIGKAKQARKRAARLRDQRGEALAVFAAKRVQQRWRMRKARDRLKDVRAARSKLASEGAIIRIQARYRERAARRRLYKLRGGKVKSNAAANAIAYAFRQVCVVGGAAQALRTPHASIPRLLSHTRQSCRCRAADCS